MTAAGGPARQPAPDAPATPLCLDEVCVTCSDTAVAVTVVTLLGDGLAIVGTGAGEEEVSVALVDARPGDTVLVHAKEAIAVLPNSAGPAITAGPAAEQAAADLSGAGW